MSLFGEHLKALIEENKVNIYALAKAAGLERTAIHKIMAGGRIPSDEYVRKLAAALPLSPEERQSFAESYNISKIGEFKYRQRIQVKNLIESIAFIENDGNIQKSSVAVERLDIQDVNKTVSGYFAVNNLVKTVIDETIAAGAKRELDFVVPVSFRFFYNELLTCYLEHPELSVRHIVAFTKKNDFPNNSNLNLELLSHVLPFAFAPGTEYYPYYYYQTAHSVELTQVLPYYILTSTNRLVLIGKDFDKAALICDRDMVELYRGSFNAALEHATMLTKRLNSAVEVLNYCINTDTVADAPSHWIEPEPCVGPLASDEMINSKIKRDLPYRDDLYKLICTHYHFLMENQLRNINICTTDGLYRMVNSGYLYNVPKALIDPISREEFKDLLILLKNRISGEKVKVLFTNPSRLAVPNNTLLQINRITGINFIMHNNSTTDFRAVCFSEDSIDEAFSDFVESIEESGLVYNSEDSFEVLNKIIDEL